MRLVTKLTGLTADSVRVWERRYNAVTPHRTDGGTRMYSDEDLRRLTLLKAAVDAGHAISAVARLDEDALRALVEPAGDSEHAATPHGPSWSQLVRDYLEHIERFDSTGAGDLLARAASVTEASVFVFEVVLPILREVGDRWHAGSLTVAHEHLVTAQVRGFLFTITRMVRPMRGAPRILVATPAGHRHDFGALVGAYLAAARGLNVVFLGADVPDDDLLDAVGKSDADVILLSVLHTLERSEMRRLCALLADCAARKDTWVGTPPDHAALGHNPDVRYFTRFEDLDAAFTMLVTRHN
jgi:methanogenic corrinoid protein MtbC1